MGIRIIDLGIPEVTRYIQQFSFAERFVLCDRGVGLLVNRKSWKRKHNNLKFTRSPAHVYSVKNTNHRTSLHRTLVQLTCAIFIREYAGGSNVQKP